MIAKPIFNLIGKGVDRGTSEDAYVMEGEKLTRYENKESVAFPKALRGLSDLEIARGTGLDPETVSRARNRKVRPQTHAKLMGFARTKISS